MLMRGRGRGGREREELVLGLARREGLSGATFSAVGKSRVDGSGRRLRMPSGAALPESTFGRGQRAIPVA